MTAVTKLIEWLLDLQNIRIAEDAPLVLQWQTRVQAWVLFGLGLLVALTIGLAYARERGSAARRVGLAICRCALLAVVIVVICQPALVLQRSRVEHSHVALVIDTTQSMDIVDQYEDLALAASVARGANLAASSEVSDKPRLDLVRSALSSRSAAPLRRLLEQNAIQLVSFAGAAEPVAYAGVGEAPGAIASAIGSLRAIGRQTDLASAIATVMQRSQGRRLAAVILATDGQSTQSTSLKDALDLASGRRVPIFPLRIGSPDPVRDIEVGPLRAPQRVFVDDLLPVEADVRVTGAASPETIVVRLIDDTTGAVLASESAVFEPDAAQRVVELRTKPHRVGEVRLRVAAEPFENERFRVNNVDRIDVMVMDNRIRVLYVDAYPRFEYRYLKNALLREKTIELSVLLLEADERFVQEGTDPIRRFPETPEELNRYDVVLFGDVDPGAGWISDAQMRLLRGFVADRGGGFGVIAGERSAPERFAGTPLETLLPVRIDAEASARSARRHDAGFRPRLTADGRRSRLFRFDDDRPRSEKIFDALPPLYWMADTLGAAPGATTLAEHPTLHALRGAMPVVAIGRYGAGHLFFQATDETWRWRRHTGEWLHDAYWVQVVRSLMPGDRRDPHRPFTVRADRRTYDYGEPVGASVEIADAQLLARAPDSIEIVVLSLPGGAELEHIAESPALGAERAASGRPPRADEPRKDAPGTDAPQTHAPEDRWAAARFEVVRIGPDSNVYEGTFTPPRPGAYALTAPGLQSGPCSADASVTFRVRRPDLEMRRPQADHEVLRRIAAATNGRVIDLDGLDEAFASIPNRSVQIPDDVTESLWDSKLVIGLFTLLVTTEWVLRKMSGML
jgi:hypothetical protein